MMVILGRGLSGDAAMRLAGVLGIPARQAADADAELPTFTAGMPVILSPGIRPDSPLLRKALAAGAETMGEMEFAARHFNAPYLALTGTNGKTTTTELATHLLNAAGRNAVAAGNIGLPFSSVAADVLEGKLPADTLIVLEVSSFQLEAVRDFAPLAAALLNLASDHLDRYPGGMARYEAIKRRIFDHVPKANRIAGISLPQEAPRVAEYRAGVLFLEDRELLPFSRLHLKGEHNLENVLAALELVHRVLPPETMHSEKFLAALCAFSAGRHRLEMLPEKRGVRAVNDSKATNPAAVIAALKALEPLPRGNIHLLAGGLDKGMNFDELLAGVPYLKKVYLYGASQETLKRVFAGRVPLDCFGQDFAEAVRTAVNAASPGDVILLAPACASMDMFRNYQERGDVFCRLIGELL